MSNYFKSKPKGIYNNADDSYANNHNFYIEIYPVHVSKTEASAEDSSATTGIKFKAFLTQFDDQFEASFDGENVFGRMDAIQVYRGTTRRISLSWDVPSGNHTEAITNLRKCSKLMSYMYPVYQSVDPQNPQGRVLTSPPLFRVKFANLITNTANGRGGAVGADASESGLLGTINGFTYTPDLESGFFTDKSNGDLLPQTISLSCDFVVMHDHPLGWDEQGKKAQPSFPYGQPEDASEQSTRSGGNDGSEIGNRIEQSDTLNATNATGGQN